MGELTLIASKSHLLALLWERDDPERIRLNGLFVSDHYLYLNSQNQILQQAETEVKEYTEGTRKTFSTPLLLSGTPFQLSVWETLKKISYGSFISYRDLAERNKTKTAIRAVASAVAKNPLSVFIPCHRIIRADGSLGEFAGGRKIKKFLFNFERENINSLNQESSIDDCDNDIPAQ